MEENLRGHIAWGSRGVFHVVDFSLFADSKVGQSEISLLLEDDVFGLDVSVDEALSVDVLEGLYETGREEFDLGFAEGLFDAHVKSEVSSSGKVHQQVEIVLVLKGGLFVDDEFVAELVKDLVLIGDGLD